MKILVAMSGGIDSTMTALLLREQGYELVGVTFRTFDSMKESCIANEKGCCTIDSIMEAKHLCESLGIEHHIVDFREAFRKSVIENFISEYQHGRTPNPCVLCNKCIKWGELLQVADKYHCEKIATGHYARIVEQDGHYYLRRAADTKKDQTYFLWQLTEENLMQTLFPLGDYTKEQVRAMAAERGYVRLSQKTESQDICFIPNGDVKGFLNQYLPDFTPYTIGQRKGLGVALGYPAYVKSINPLTFGHHDELYTHDVALKDGYFRGDRARPVMAQIRYRSAATEARYDGALHFAEPVWAVTPGQSAVMYQDDLLVGGGVISD